MSLASTGGLAALFAVTTPTSGGEIQSAAVVIGPTAALTPATPATTIPASATSAAANHASAAAAPSPTTSSPATVPATSTTMPAADVVVDGAVFHNKWGDVQVEATFSAEGRLVDVAALRTPNDRRKSVQINDYAVPRLTSEALTAQSAKVNTVSGATYTSVDYRNSLQSAIDAAVQAGVVVATV
jgi:uncharacterized protein with FMN-binding domain